MSGILTRAAVQKWSIVSVLFAFALLVRIIAAFTIPPWQSPDEPRHFEYVRVLADKRVQLWEERRFPDVIDASPVLQHAIISSMAEHHYWEYLGGVEPNSLPAGFGDMWASYYSAVRLVTALSPLYYLVEAGVLIPLQQSSLEQQLLALRLLSAVLSAAAAAVTYFAAREVVPEDPFIAIVGAAFVATLPMHVFIGGAVNPDAMVSLMGSLFAYGLALGFRRGFSLRRWVSILSLLLLALASKRTAFGLFPSLLATGMFCLASLRGRRLAIVGGGLLLGGIITGIVVSNDWLAQILNRVSPRDYGLMRDWALKGGWGRGYLGMVLDVQYSSAETWGFAAGLLVQLFRSFWGIFGWFNLPLSPELYYVLAIVSLLAVLGFFTSLAWYYILLVKRSSTGGDVSGRTLVVYLVAVGAMVLLAVAERLGYMDPGQVPQGRYLFVVVTPIAIIFALGLRAFLPRRLVGTRLPSVICLAALVGLDVFVYTGTILPFYVWRVFS